MNRNIINKADQWAGNVAPLSGGGNVQAGNFEARGLDTLRTIMEQPVYVALIRLDPVTQKTIVLAPQVMRVDVVQSIRNASEKFDAMMSVSDQYVVIMALKDNPFAPNTDIQRSDMFFFAQQMWEVSEFLPTIPGRLMASGKLKP